MSYPRVSIIILNWNGWRDTIECLESLYRVNYSNYEVIVVDNGSRDNSIQKIREYCKGLIEVKSKFFEYDPSNKPIYVLEYTREEAEKGGNPKKEKYFSKLPSNRKLRLILNEKNYGFAEGNNIGIRFALRTLDPDYVLLLNNDTVVDRNFLIELVRVAESNKNIGIVGPKIYYYDYKGRSDIINFAGGLIDLKKCKFSHIGINKPDDSSCSNIRYVDYIDGACLMIRKKVIEDIGLLDPIYFCYVEEIDWCLRAKIAGFNLVYVPSAKIWHKCGASSGGNLSYTYVYYRTRNRLILIHKYNNNINMLISFMYFMVDLIKLNILAIKLGKNVRDTLKGAFNGIIDFYKYYLKINNSSN